MFFQKNLKNHASYNIKCLLADKNSNIFSAFSHILYAKYDNLASNKIHLYTVFSYTMNKAKATLLCATGFT